MRVVWVPEDPPPAKPPGVVATIGKFDGVHRGHCYLLGKVIERAAELDAQSAVVTFDPHPNLVIRPHAPLRLLSTLADRLEWFAELGIDTTLVWRFDRALQHTSAEAFLEQLNRWVRLRRLIHGPGFALGYRRQGTAAVIAEIGGWLGFDVEEVTPVPVAGASGASSAAGAAGLAGAVSLAGALEPGGAHGTTRPGDVVSSSAIRALVEAGRIRRAARALGHPPTVAGIVVEGERVGRKLGFPTANLRIDQPLLIPADGVYATYAELAPYTPAAQRLPAAVSIGTRPTFDGHRRVVEAYLLDFAGDLYGQRLRLHFIARLRGQERFASVDALVAQMRRDVETVRALLTQEHANEDVMAALAADG